MSATSSGVFWQKFREHAGVNNDFHAVTQFKTAPDVADRLLAMVLAGAKRAVASPLQYFVEGSEEPMPAANDYVVLEDPRGRPRLIWRTTATTVGPLSSVSDQYLWNDGEGDGNRDRWLAGLRRSFTLQAKQRRFEMHDEIGTVFETFEVVWPLRLAERLRLLSSHLDRGFALHQQLDSQQSLVRGLEAVLGRIQTAVMTVGRDMRLHFANPAADVLIRRGDGLLLRASRVTARVHAEALALEAAVATAAQRVASSSTFTGGTVLAISRKNDPPCYRATILPLSRTHASRTLGHSADAILFVEDPDISDSTQDAHDVFRQAFGLTNAEARLAASLAAGNTLTDAAQTFGITQNTIRTQLRAAFDKTGARRQSDLVRILQAARSLKI